jgi:chemotaxis protein MotB
MSSTKPIIVKKIKKYRRGGHHGGAWKVAYADFVTAMMAFFLLLWLLSMVSDEKRARISAYFKYFSLYESGGTSWMDKSSEIFGESGENKQKAFKGLYDPSSNEDDINNALNVIEKSLKKDIAEKLGDLQEQILVDNTGEGIRIQMIDKEGSLMFEQGSTRLTPKAKEVLKFISSDIKDLTNKVIIEGHTDSLPYSGTGYSNWELSTERASSARIELEANGLDPKKITRVAGYADTDPLIKDNPQDPRNRRISITLNVPRKNNAKAIDLHHLQDTSKEFLEIIENEKISPVKKTVKSKEVRNMNDAARPYMKKPEWPAFRPVKKELPIMNGEGEYPVIKTHDIDSMIKEGQFKLKNGNTEPGIKAKLSQDNRNKSQNSAGEGNTNSPAVIKELLEPLKPVIQEGLFSVQPQHR